MVQGCGICGTRVSGIVIASQSQSIAFAQESTNLWHLTTMGLFSVD